MVYINDEKYPGPQVNKHLDQDASPAMKELMGYVKKTQSNFSWEADDLEWLITAMKWPCASPSLASYAGRMQKWKEVLKKHETETVVKLRREVSHLTSFIGSLDEKLRNYGACTPKREDVERDIESAKQQYLETLRGCQRELFLASRNELKETLPTAPQGVVITEKERAYLSHQNYANDFIVEAGCREHNNMTQRTIDLIDEIQTLWRKRIRMAALAKERLNKMYYTKDNEGVVPYAATVRLFGKDYVKLNLKEAEQDQPQTEAENELFFQPLTPPPTQVDWRATAAQLLGLFLVQKRREELDASHPPLSVDEYGHYDFVELLKLGHQHVVEAENKLLEDARKVHDSVKLFLKEFKEVSEEYRGKETFINTENARDPKRLAIDAKVAYADLFAQTRMEIDVLNTTLQQKHQAHMNATPQFIRTMDRLTKYVAEQSVAAVPDVAQLGLKLKTIGFIDEPNQLVAEYQALQSRVMEATVRSETIAFVQNELSDAKREVFAWEEYLAATIEADFYPPNYLLYYFKQGWRKMTGNTGAAGRAQLNADAGHEDSLSAAAANSDQIHTRTENVENKRRWVVGDAQTSWNAQEQDDAAGSSSLLDRVDDDGPLEE